MIMKTRHILFGLASAAMMTIAGCETAEIKDVQSPEANASSFELIADITQTKTTLDPQDGYKVAWEEGDIIYMVTSDGTWGVPFKEDQTTNSIAEFTYADGKFSTEATIADGEYTFKGMYAAESQKSYHRGASSTHKLQATQTQDCADPTAHIKDNDALVGTFTATVPMSETAKMNMSHLHTLMQVDVKNTTGEAIEVTKFEMTAEGADLAGVFNVEAFDIPAISTKSGASSTITVNITGGDVENNASLPVYFVMAPFADYSGDVTFKVTDSNENTYTKTVAMNGISFEAGKYNTTSYTISVADEVEPEPANVTWDLTKDQTSEASEERIAWTSEFAEMYCAVGTAGTKPNNYYGGDANSRTSTRFYKNSILTIAPKTGYAITSVVFTATSDSYATALSSSTWNNAAALAESKTVTVNPTDGAQAMTATIGGTCGFTSVVVYYAVSEGGETPEPGNKTLVSIAVENPKTEYTVGDTFVEPTVKATYDDASTATVTGATFTGNDLTSEGTKTVTVSYTEGEVTATTTFDITVSEQVDYSGTYAIVAYRNTNTEKKYYYLTNEETETATVRLTAVLAGENKPNDNVEVAASKLWNVSKSGSAYTIQSVASDEYVSWTTGNSANMSETGTEFTITKNDDETYCFGFADGDDIRYLSLNTTAGSNYFAMYKGSQTQNLYLIKAVEGEEAPATLESIAVSGQTTDFTVGDEFAFGGTVTATYSDGTTADVTSSATFAGYNMSAAGTYEVTVTYEGKTCTYNITVSAPYVGEGKFVKVTSAPSDWSGTYLIVYEDGKFAFDGSLTTLDASSNTKSVTITNNEIAATTNMLAITFEIAKSNESYTIKSKSGYFIGNTTDSNKLASSTTTGYTNTITLNKDGSAHIVGSGSSVLRYNANSDQKRFRYFKSTTYSSQKAIHLYKLEN